MSSDDLSAIATLLTQLPEELAEQVRKALGESRQIKAQAVKIARGSVKSLLFGLMDNGVWRARGISAQDVKLSLTAAGLALEKSHVELHIEAEAAFQYPSLRGPKTWRSRPVPAKVKTPELSRIGLSFLTRELNVAFNMAAVDMGDGEFDVLPTAEVDAGAAVMSDIQAIGIETDPLRMSGGMDLGRILLDRLGLDGARVAELRLGGMAMEGPIKLTKVAVRNAKVIDAEIGDLGSEALDLDFEIGLPRVTLKSFPDLPDLIDRLITRLWIEIQPTVVFHVGNLCLEGVRLSAEIGRIEIEELEVPISASSVSAREVHVEEVSAESVEV